MTEAGVTPQPSAAPRRRNLTILFSDLSDSTRIAGRLDPEDYADLLTLLQAIYHRAVEAHGGAVAQISGDGMLAIFGHPEPREDDGRRAVEAALALNVAAAALEGEARWAGERIRLHSGVHAGLVLLHEGDTVRGRFEVTGSATNIAARLCDFAEAGQILVSEATLGPERHLFMTGARSHLSLKGKEEPVATLAVLAAAPARTRYAASVRGGLTPFVGRTEELEGLENNLEDAIAGHARFVEIEGPPGVGKTRLAEETLARATARGALVHRGECDAAGAPLQPFVQIARSIFGLHRPLPAEEALAQVDALLDAAGPALGSHRPALLRLLSLSRQEPAVDMATALCTLFVTLAGQAPLVLFIDDWHLADDASREMLGGLRGLDRHAVFLLVTARPDIARISEFDVMPLAPFSDAETAEAVSRLLAAPDPFVIREVGASSGGNALFIEELCHSIADGRLGDGTPWLDTLIESRLLRLPGPQGALVRKAAVIGTIVPTWLLEAVTGHDEADPLVAGLADQDFIFRGEREGTLRFKHGITRETVYASVGLRERRALHLEIAAALRGREAAAGEEEPLEALAYHYGAGEDWGPAARYAEQAGDRAMAVSALDRAQAQYRAALTALDRLPQSDEVNARWGRIAQRFGLAGVFDPSRDQLPVFVRAVERAAARRDKAALAWAEYWLGYINYGLGEAGAAIDHCLRALEAAVGLDDDRLVVQIRATLGQARAAVCDYRGALLLLDEAIEVKRRHRTGGRPSVGFAYSLACKAFTLGDLGRFAEARATFVEAMAAAGGAQHEVESSVLCQWSAICLWQGRLGEALDHAAAAGRVAERVRTRYLHAMSRSLAGYARWCRDGDADAIPGVRQATTLLEESGMGQFISLNYGWLAEMLAVSGDVSGARLYAARALWRARRGDRLGEAMAWRALARLATTGGVRHPAVDCLARAYAAARGREAPHEIAATRLCEAELALAAGDRAGAALRLAEAMPSLAAMGMAWQSECATRLAAALKSP